MDLWVVAAAAGAGYVAKNLQNLSLDKKESSGAPPFKYSANVQSESRNLLQQLRDKTCPFRRLARKKAEADAFLDVENHLSFNSSDKLSDRVSEACLASLEKNELPEDYNLCTIAKLPSDFNTDEEKMEFEAGEVRNFTRVNRAKLVRNRKRSDYSIRPLNPLGSFLDTQIRREHEREEQTLNGLIPSISVERTVLITSGSQIFSRSNSDSSFEQFDSGKEKVERENDASIKANGVKSSSASLQGHDVMLLFVTGMIIGISSVTTASKYIVDKLNKQLKETQSLVEDLHEELDMKDMVTVKELTDHEGYLPPGGSNTSLSNQEPNASPSENFVKSSEKVDLMSKIEAELEAELEMLERNMMESKLEIISNVFELGSDFEPDIAQGDLKPMKGREIHGDVSESENKTTDTNPNNNYYEAPNYAVCPWELSLRLHELIETRLQARVKELEIALANTKNGLQFQKEFTYSEARSSSSTPCTPTFVDKRDEYNKILHGISSRGECNDQEKEDEDLGTTAGDHGAFWKKHKWSGFMSYDDCRNEGESSDESETLLLERIIERTKSGSSAVFELLRSRESGLMA